MKLNQRDNAGLACENKMAKSVKMRANKGGCFRRFSSKLLNFLENNLAPQASALPDCAMPRHVDFTGFFIFVDRQKWLSAKTFAKTNQSTRVDNITKYIVISGGESW